MDAYTLVLYLHVLLFVYWLGGDLGVFALALTLKNKNYSVEQRMVHMRLSLTIDMIPRVCMATIAPVGLWLASELELVSYPDWLGMVLWVVAAIWIAAEFTAFKNFDKPIALKMYMITGVVFLAGFLGFGGYGLYSLINGEPFMSPWLAMKVFLFGMIFLVSIMMAVFYAPLEAIFATMLNEGSSPELEAKVTKQVNRGAFFTVLLFVLLVTMGFLGLAKPGL
jgi:hypothetical protein